MKFHRVKIKNLNSLYGTQSIDFERDVRDSPIFLIQGPTGSGKSTILDAICLALFGQTPRLDRTTGRIDRDVGHVMSLGTADCAAEVEFSMREADGTRSRFLATWSLRRAHGQPDGAIQRAERALARVRPGGAMELLVSDHRAKFFEPAFNLALKGLTVEDFKRSILLAQGEFSAFLHASDDEKASILERLTSTDVYRVIGARAAAKRRVLEERHRELVRMTSDSLRLPVEERKALDRTIYEARDEVTRLRGELNHLREAQESAVKEEELQSQIEALIAREAAANEKLDAAAGVVERLQRDEAVQPVETQLWEIKRLAAESQSISTDLDTLTTSIKQTALERETCVAAFRECEAAVAARVEAKRLAEPRLREGERLEERLKHTDAELEAATAEFEKLVVQETKLDAEFERISTVQLREQSLLQTLNETLESGLEEEAYAAFDGTKTWVDAGVRPRLRELKDRQKRLGELTQKRDEAAKALEVLRAQRKESDQKRGTLQAVVTRSRRRVAQLVGDATVSAYRESLDLSLQEWRGKYTALREASLLLGRLRTLEDERNQVQDAVERARGDVEAIAREEAVLKTVETSQRLLVEERESNLRLTERIAVLSELRTQLEHGEPCPLCGSPLHPYCLSDELGLADEDLESKRVVAQERLAESRSVLAQTHQEIQRQAAKYVSRTTSMRHDEARQIALQEELEISQRTFATNAEKGGIPPLEVFRLKHNDALEVALNAAKSTLTDLEQSYEEFERRVVSLEKAEAKLKAFDEDSESDEFEAQKAVLAEIETRLDAANSEAASVQHDVNELLAKLRVRLGEYVSEPIPEPFDVDEWVVRATQNVESFAASLDRKKTLVASIEKSEAALTLLQERRADLMSRKELSQLAVEARAIASAAAHQALTDLLGDDSLEGLRRAVGESVEEATSALEAARKSRDAVERDAARLETRKAALEERLELATQSQQTLTAEVEPSLDALGIELAEALAHLLSSDERARLRARVQALRDDRRGIRDRLRETREKRDARLESRPAHLRTYLVDSVIDRDRLRDDLSGVEDAANAKTLALGALEEKRRADDAAAERESEFAVQLQEVQAELDTWKPLAQLIGVNDGASFKQFAQALNLRGLVERANRRLEHLHPRYELAVAHKDGAPTLSFSIIDRYQARVERPLTTLSGGETFLVSLALALALADYRRVEFPVETLLLDEGFGTLDQDALHMALRTLHQLHADGTRQIGIISHVDALKDMVDARIVLKKLGQGRSQIAFEHGHSHLAV